MTTVVCLDDYHSLDRQGRKRESVTALDPKAQNFDLMYEQIKDMKEGKTVAKPIYNHVTGNLDDPEDTSAAKVGPHHRQPGHTVLPHAKIHNVLKSKITMLNEIYASQG